MNILKTSYPEAPLVIIVGPTAVGKTQLSIQLAEQLNGEIVSADSRLFYREMDIGTAKPSAADMTRVPHHLIDVADPDETWSLAVFQQTAHASIRDIHARGKLPLLVGGTGQYVRAVTEGWLPPEVRSDDRLRLTLENLAAEHDPYWLHAKLEILDPTAAAKIDARNLRRTVRALEVIFSTGRLFSVQRRLSISPYRLITVGLMRPRPELYQRVDERIEAMFENGLLAEVSALLARGYSADLPTMSAIGYRECIQVLQGQMTADAARVQMKRLTRVFIRRQSNWFKENDPEIRWFNLHNDTQAQVAAYITASLA